MSLTPFEVTGIFFFASLILSIAYMAINEFTISSFKKYWKIIVILALANIAMKIPYQSLYFDGLEYEDSYIYKSSARALYEGDYEYSSISPYYPTSCVYGSLNDCNMSAIFVTNYLGYPYLINAGYRLFGFHVNVSNIVSLVFSGLSIVLLFLVALLILNRLIFALFCCFAYLTIPIFNVFASTSLTEPLANAYLTLVLLLYLMFMNPDIKPKRALLQYGIGLSALFFSLIFSILVKTTNLSLVLCLPAVGLLFFLKDIKLKDRYARYRYLYSLPIFISSLMFSFLILKFQTAVEINRGDIGVNPFSFSFFKSLAPIFAGSFFEFHWYLFYGPVFLVGLFYGLSKKKALFPVLIFFFYFALYTFHYRSYYFTRGFPATNDESLRYMTSIVSAFSLIVGLGGYFLWQTLTRILPSIRSRFIGKMLLASLLVIVLSLSMINTLKNRVFFAEDERYVRFEPVKETIKYLPEKDSLLITSEHILFQIYGDVDLRLIDFGSIGIHVPMEEVTRLVKSSNVFYLETIKRDSLDAERYQPQFQFIDYLPKEPVYYSPEYRLFRLVPGQY